MSQSTPETSRLTGEPAVCSTDWFDTTPVGRRLAMRESRRIAYQQKMESRRIEHMGRRDLIIEALLNGRGDPYMRLLCEVLTTPAPVVVTKRPKSILRRTYWRKKLGLPLLTRGRKPLAPPSKYMQRKYGVSNDKLNHGGE